MTKACGKPGRDAKVPVCVSCMPASQVLRCAVRAGVKCLAVSKHVTRLLHKKSKPHAARPGPLLSRTSSAVLPAQHAACKWR